MKDKIDFDDFATDYDDMLKKQHHFFDKNNDYFSEYKVARVKRILKNNLCRKILDYGCGTGRTIEFFQRYFPAASVSGCDVSEQSLAIAKKKFPNAIFYQADELISSGRHFDLIFLSGVLHHVEPDKRESLLSDLTKLLAPKGHMVVFEHNPYNPIARYMVNTCPFDRDAVLLSPAELRKLYLSAGIPSPRCDFTLFFPALLCWLRVLEPYMRLIPLGGQYMLIGQLS